MKTVRISFTILDTLELEDYEDTEEKVNEIRKNIEDALFDLSGTLGVNDVEWDEE